jgi:putative ABC transport system permease protein
MGEITRNLEITLRSLARQPGMALVVVLALALGIGASTALFAYVTAIAWPTLEAPEPERAVWLYTGTAEEPRPQTSYPEYLDLQRQQSAVRDIVGASACGATVSHGQASSYVWCHLVSGNYFSFFGARPAAGRLFQPEDDRAGAEPVAVVSYLFWKRTLGGDPAVLGRPLRLNGQTFTLVGVAPKDFQGIGLAFPLYVPLAQSDRLMAIPRFEKRELRWLTLLGRLAPSVTLAQAREALDLAARSLDESAPLPDGKRRFAVLPVTVFDAETGGSDLLAAARVLLVAALLFVLLACANVANLLLARATVRQRELGIRASLGASRRLLVGSVLSESLILCFAGGALGLAFAAGMARRIDAYVLTAPGGLGSWSEGSELVRLDPRAFLFALAVALLCGLLCGLAPALRVLRGDLLAAVKTDAAGAVGPTGALAPRKLLVIAQVGLSVLLLLGGSLLLRTLRNAERTDPGFDPERLLLASLYVPRNVGATGVGANEVYRRVLEQVASAPGVQSATLAHAVPLAGYSLTTRMMGRERPDRPVEAAFDSVAPGYFETLGIPILQGRAFDRRDRRDSLAVVVVSQQLARRLWGNANPVGRILSMPDPPPRPGEPGPDFEVIGVVRDVRAVSPVEPPGPFAYFAVEQRFHPRLSVIVRASGPPAALAPTLRRAVLAAHPDLSIIDLMTGGEQLRRSLAQQRMHAEVASLFGLLGLGVAVIGLFALLSYTVSLRVREFGIRMAIGARRRDVERLVLRQGMALVGIGLALGLLGALALTRLLESLLFGVAAHDSWSFLGVAAGLTLVTLTACYLPARRASRLDPLEALREG